MGGAQPLEAELAVKCDPHRIEARLRAGYLSEMATYSDTALEMIDRWRKKRETKSLGLLGNAADVFSKLVRRGVRPDIVTDRTYAHDPLNGYLPSSWSLEE